MDDTGSLCDPDPKNLYKRPGPRLSACQWCGKVSCNHCRCTGQANCTHAPGEMCKNPRYKRRLVCNPCEKNKLKYRQMCQQSAEKKQEISHSKQPINTIPQPPHPDSMSVNNEDFLPHSCLVSSPNIAIMFYKTRTLLTLLPLSTIQGTLSHLRNLIDSMMLLSSGIRYFFIKDNIIVANDEELTSPATDIIREYVFPFPVNCTRCIFIHYISQNVLPVNQPIPPSQPQIPGTWPPTVYPSNSFVYTQNQLMSQMAPIPDPSPPTPIETKPIPPAVQSYLLQSGMDPAQKNQFPRLSGDSAQWSSVQLADPVMPTGGLPPMDIQSGVYNPLNRPSEGLHMFRDEGVSNEYLQKNSYGDMSFIHPFAPNRMLHRPSASSDLNWPVFPPRSEEMITPVLADNQEKQRNSILSMEDLKLSAALTGLKREQSTKKPEGEETHEESKSCDRLSLIANIALKEYRSREEE